jgi:hypothetical protein
LINQDPHPSRRTQNQPTLSTNHPHAIGYRNGVLMIVAVHSSCNSVTWMNEHWVFLWLLQLLKSMVLSSSNSLIRCMGIQFFVDFVQFVHSSYDNTIVDDEIIVFFQFSIIHFVELKSDPKQLRYQYPSWHESTQYQYLTGMWKGIIPVQHW